MKTRVTRFVPKLKKSAAMLGVAAVLAVSAAPAAFAQASGDDAALDAAITEVQGKATSTIGKFAAPLLTVAGVGVAIGIGTKYIKKFRGAS